MAEQQPQPMRVFYSYSHKDAALRDELETHLAALKRGGIIQGWSDRAITGGQDWAGQIDANLEAADMILLLVSADFINSDYCYGKEMARALERHAAGTARVIPIVLRPVDWETTPFHKLQALPAGAKAVTTWPNRDEAWVDVVRGIRKAIQALADKRKIPEILIAPEKAVVEENLATELVSSNELAKDMTNVQSYKVTLPEGDWGEYRTLLYKGHRIDVCDGSGWEHVFYDLREVSKQKQPVRSLNFRHVHLFSASEGGQEAHYEVGTHVLWRWRITVKRNGTIIWKD